MNFDSKKLAMQIGSNGRISTSTMLPPTDFQEETMSDFRPTDVAEPSEFGLKLQKAFSEKEKETGEKINLRPTTVQTVETTSNKKVNKMISFKTIDPASRTTRRIDSFTFRKPVEHNSDINNRSLDIFLNGYFKRLNIDENFTIHGSYDRNTRPYVIKECIWDEGGSYALSGHALIATDSNGYKLSPNFVYHNSDIVNNRHALMPIKVGYYILMGGWSSIQNKSVIAIYKVNEIDKEFTNTPRYKCSLIAYKAENEWTKYNKEDTLWNEDSPAVVAIEKRIHEKDASTPCYIRRYRDRKLNADDFNDMIKDEAFMSSKEDVATLTEAYQKADEILKVKFKDVDRSIYPAMYVVVSKDEENIVVSLFGCMYNAAESSSVNGRLFYYQVVLTGEDSFCYPDVAGETTVSLEDVKKSLETANEVVTFFRRVSE